MTNRTLLIDVTSWICFVSLVIAILTPYTRTCVCVGVDVSCVRIVIIQHSSLLLLFTRNKYCSLKPFELFVATSEQRSRDLSNPKLGSLSTAR